MWLPPAASLAQDSSCPLLGPSLGTRVSAQAGGYGCCFPLCRFNVDQCGAHIPEIFTDRRDTDKTGHIGCPHRGLPSTALEWPAQDSSKAQTQCFLPAAGVDAHPPLSRLINTCGSLKYWHGPSANPAVSPHPKPLPTTRGAYSLTVPAGCTLHTQHSQTRPSCTPYLQVPLGVTAQTSSHLMPRPRLKVPATHQLVQLKIC